MSNFKQLILGVSIIGVTLISNIMLPVETAPKSAQAVQSFDHSQCQYPDRNTNPPNGCDNSDPACPETIKFGYDCEPPVAIPQPEVVAPDEPVKPNECEGK